MRIFFKYFGGKYKLARHYGPPRSYPIIEPFAGSAGYSCFYDSKKTILIEKDPCIYGMWHWLIHEATPDDIMDLDISITDLSQCEHYPQPIRDFIGFWFGRGNTRPSKKLAPNNLKLKLEGNGSYWGKRVQDRVATNLPKIKNWEIIHGDYTDAPDIEGHWHIDPPYQFQGKHYYCGPDAIDFNHLGEWCLSRKGTGEVCEADPADWLPFEAMKTRGNQTHEKYTELIYRLDRDSKGSLFES